MNRKSVLNTNPVQSPQFSREEGLVFDNAAYDDSEY